MSDMPEYPTLEPRRGRQLRQDFLRDMAAIAPQWRGLAEAAGTDRALLEIAARLLEHSTRRLDKTPERDGLAFLDMLDVPAPQPRSAEGHAVIALDADQDAPVQLEGRAGFDLDNDGETVRFETTDALNIHPARVVSLFTVDPAADQIGEAPPAVVALEADNSEELSYQLDSAVGGNDRILRLSFATGLEEGDLLRIEEETDQIRIRQIESVSDDGLVTLTEPVGTPELFPGKVALRKMSWLDAFSMPDKQEHALYVGDAAALDVSPQAEITLSFKGRQSESLSSADAIAATPSVVEIWGQKGDDEEPGWHRLPEVARTVDTVTYLKAWAGPVLEAEIAPDQKNRWLRLRRLGPITLGSDEADLHKLRVDQIFIQVKMLVNEATPPADTISQAAHNATPLPISDTFFPFGTEPQRFDSFALAAPEVFTKSGAKAKLKFDMQDATLVAMQSVLAETGMRRPHIFGVGKNGRIQVLDRAASSQYWLEVDALEPGGTDAPPVNVDFGIQAVTVPPAVDQINLVLVEAGTEGSPQLYVVPIEVADSVLTDGQGNGGAGKWQALNMHRDSQVPAKMRSAVALVPMVVGGANPSAAQVYWVTTTGVHRFRLAANGAPATGAAWEEVGNDLSAPTLDETARIVPMQGSFEGGEGSFLITDENQTLWKLSVDATGAGSWANLGLVVQENSLVEAVSWHEQGGGELDTIAFVPPGGGLKIWNTGGADDDVDPPAGYGEPAWFALIQGIAPQPIATTEQYDRPSLVAVYAGAGTAILVERNLEPTGEALRHQIGALGDITVALPRAASESAKIVTALGDQTIASLTFNPAVEAEFLTWFSADVASGDVTDLRIEHSNGDFTNVGKSFQVGNTATRRIAFPDGIDPDPAFGMELWHMDAGITGAFNDGTGRVQSSTGALPTAGAPVFIAPSGSGDFRRYTVDATQGATDTFTVDEETELAAHIGGSGNVVFREVQGNAPLETVAAVDVPDRLRTLGVFYGIGSLPKSMRLPGESPAIPVPNNPVPFALGGLVLIDFSPWTAPLPVDGHVKVLLNNETPQILITEPLDRSYQGPELSWEYFDGKGWKRLDEDFNDQTNNLAKSGTISFRIPNDLTEVNIGGQDDLWIRARLVGGDYGRPKYQVTTDPFPPAASTTQSISILTGHMRPPEVASLIASFYDMPLQMPEKVLARNNLRLIDQTSANGLRDVHFDVFQGAYVAPLGNGNNAPMLYLGLSKPLTPGLTTLFARTEDREGDIHIDIETLGADLSWTRAPLTGGDPTHGLYQSGLLKFSTAAEQVKANLFGQSLYWLRIVGKVGWQPRIHGLWLNGVAIVQAETVKQELLGSSLGAQSAQFKLLKSPVLENTLELRVRENLSIEEVETLRLAREQGDPEPVLEDVANISGQWVYWRQVGNLDAFGADRVYLLAPDGTITFGSGEHGRIPPAGRDGIRAFSYQVGGLPVSAEPSTELKPIAPKPGFETAFIADTVAGGTNIPNAAELLAGMPDALRHQNRALSLSDLEAIARNFDTDITQVRAEHTKDQPGLIRVHVLAKGKTRTRVYSAARREALGKALASRMSDAYGADCLDVRSVEFVRHQITISLRAAPGHSGAVETEAKRILTAFFDPARGGPYGNGWPVGRPVWPLDIDRVLRDINGLESIIGIEIARHDELQPDAISSYQVVFTAFAEDLNVIMSEGEAP